MSAPTSRGNGSTRASTRSWTCRPPPSRSRSTTIAREKNKVYLNSGAATSDLTGAQCSPNTVHWTYDTYMLAKCTGAAMVRSRRGQLVLHHRRLRLRPCAGARHHAISSTRPGGRVLGAARTPFPATTDFSAFLLQAQASRAPRCSAWPMPAPTPSTPSRARASSACTAQHEARRAADGRGRHPRARPRGRAGAAADREPSTGTSTTAPAR